LTFLNIAAPLAAATASAVTPAPVPTPAPIITTQPLFKPIAFGLQHPFFTGAVETMFLVATVGVILLMSVQTTKNEGLSGSIGGRTEAAYRGRIGLDQQLQRATSFLAVAWIVLAIALLIITSR
jgi:protein translocase SecG subunit